jgi:SPW repeat
LPTQLIIRLGPVTGRAAAIVTLLGGIWLVMSPWALGYAGDHLAWLNETITGAALIVLCAEAAGLTGLRRAAHRDSARPSAAGSVVAETPGRHA